MASFTHASTAKAMDKLRDFISVNGDKPPKERNEALITLGEYLGLDREEQGDLLDDLMEVLGGANAESMYVSGAYLGFLLALLVLDYEETDRADS